MNDLDDNSLDIALQQIKQSLAISKPNSDMTDDEIKAVVRKLGEIAPDTTYDENGQPVFGPEGINILLCVSLYYFPKYYEKFELSQPQ